MAARASHWVIWGLVAAILAFTFVAYTTLVEFGGQVLIEKLVIVLAILAVGFAAITTRAVPPTSLRAALGAPVPSQLPLRPQARAGDASGPLIVGIVAGASLVAASLVGVPIPSSTTICSGCSPWTLAMSAPTQTNPAPGLYWNSITISAMAGLTTGLFTLSLENSTGAAIPPGAASLACRSSPQGTLFVPADCGAPAGGWYAVLYWTANGSVANVLGNATGGWTTPVHPVTDNETLVVVSPGSLAHSSDVLAMRPTGNEGVAGESGPF